MKTITSTCVAGNKITYVVSHEGTEDCQVLFRTSKTAYKSFLEFYMKSNNVFVAFEIYAQGGGWYAAYSTHNVVDGALRIRRLINHALSVNQTGLKPSGSTEESNPTRNQSSSRRVVSRAAQALVGKLRETLSLRDSVIGLELRRITSSLVHLEKMQQLQKKYSH